MRQRHDELEERSNKKDKDENDDQIGRKPDFSILCGVQKKNNSTYTDALRFIAEILSDITEKDDCGHKHQELHEYTKNKKDYGIKL